MNITARAVDDHAAEEDRVEPREWAAEAGDETPVQRKIGVAGVVYLHQ